MGPPLCRRSLYSQCVCVCSRAQARQVADLRPRRGASATRPLHLGRGRLVCACTRRAGARPERGGPLAPGAPVSRAGAAEVAARHDRRARRSLLPHVHSAGGPCHLPAQGARCGLPRILIYSTSVHANVRDAAHFRIAARQCPPRARRPLSGPPSPPRYRVLRLCARPRYFNWPCRVGSCDQPGSGKYRLPKVLPPKFLTVWVWPRPALLGSPHEARLCRWNRRGTRCTRKRR